MWDERIPWLILVAVVSALLFRNDTSRDYVVLGIIVVVSFLVLVRKPYQPLPATGSAFLLILLSIQLVTLSSGLTRSSPMAPGVCLSFS
jgi:hypothetical protein